jgi:hypothetical protein
MHATPHHDAVVTDRTERSPRLVDPSSDLQAVRASILVPRARWGIARRVVFRLLFAYFVLFFFPLPSGLADPEWLSGVFDRPWHAIVAWVGEHLLHRTITVLSNGSGDTTYDYVRVGCMLSLAAVAAIVWSVADRRRQEYRTLHGWARVWLRYVLAFSMLTYGFVKVIKLQFPSPSPARLTETFGESSPMGLLWSFMGYSTAYTFFAGAGELLGALLLLFRRTATLGALVVAAVMSNVVMLNFCYDVPVKIGSSHLLALALFLAAPDAGRLVDVLVLNRPSAPADLGPRLERLWLRRAALATKVLVIAGVMGTDAWNAVAARRAGRADPLPPDGWYAVSSFTEDGHDPSSAPDGARRWTMFALRRGYVRLWVPDRSNRLFKVAGDAVRPLTTSLTLLPLGEDQEPIEGASPVGELHLDVTPDGRATVTGRFEGRTIAADLARQRGDSFPLMQRGFHWVNEYPLNR